MLLKINQKINEILDAFLNSIWGKRRWSTARRCVAAGCPEFRNCLLGTRIQTRPAPPEGGGGSKTPHGDTPPPPFFWVSLVETLLFSRHLALLVNPNLVPGWCHVGSSFGSNFGFVWLDV